MFVVSNHNQTNFLLSIDTSINPLVVSTYIYIYICIYMYIMYITHIYIYIHIYIYLYSDIMRTIQCTQSPHHHNGFVATCPFWMASGGVHALLVLEPTECSTSMLNRVLNKMMSSCHHSISIALLALCLLSILCVTNEPIHSSSRRVSSLKYFFFLCGHISPPSGENAKRFKRI